MLTRLRVDVFHQLDRVDQSLDLSALTLHEHSHVLAQRPYILVRRKRRQPLTQFGSGVGVHRRSRRFRTLWRRRREMLGEKLNVAPERLGDDVHVAARAFSDFVRVPARALTLLAQFLCRRKGLEVVLGRQDWQNLLYQRKPAIEIFEMFVNHRGVHRPQLLEEKAASGPPF
jgi:hypothetical protein